MSDLLLPEDGLLLHVGPHKTGTTAVQSAFFAASSTLREHGVRYPGRKWHFWQYQSDAHVAGIRGKVDRNAFFGSPDQFADFLQGVDLPL